MALPCIHGHDAIVRLLLEHVADQNLVHGWTRFERSLGEDEWEHYGHPMALGAGLGHEAVDRVLPRSGLETQEAVDATMGAPVVCGYNVKAEYTPPLFKVFGKQRESVPAAPPSPFNS